MSDRLTQLQICLDQFVEQFCATLNYIDKNHDFVAAPGEEKMTDPQATVEEPEKFKETINELSVDLILKVRQIVTLISSLPGAGVSPSEQLLKIEELQKELVQVENDKIEAIRKKDDLLDFTNNLILEFTKDLLQKKNKSP